MCFVIHQSIVSTTTMYAFNMLKGVFCDHTSLLSLHHKYVLSFAALRNSIRKQNIVFNMTICRKEVRKKNCGKVLQYFLLSYYL